MAEIISAETLVSNRLSPKDRVLLINPPVEETRYSWIRWNQPLDLLKIASFLRQEVGCTVHLLDFMLPDKNGKVPLNRLTGERSSRTVGEVKYPMWRFGKPHSSLKQWVKLHRDHPPTQVWISSLCSFWFQSVAEMCRTVRQELPDIPIVFLGQYARLMPEHAAERCSSDLVVMDSLDVSAHPSGLDLYRTPPPFVAVQLRKPKAAIDDIRAAVRRRIYQVTFFEEDICCNDGESLREVVEGTRAEHRHLRYNVLCGLHLERLTPTIATMLADKQFAQLHFEPLLTEERLDLEVYRRAKGYLSQSGLTLPHERVSGFVWVGRPGEQLELLIRQALGVLQQLGGVILKPFAPTPGEREHRENAEYLRKIPHFLWSPHFFPFSELNGIHRREYNDLYRLAAFLNERVANRAFDFLDGTLGSQLLRSSLGREVWNLEPSPLRLTDQSTDL